MCMSVAAEMQEIRDYQVKFMHFLQAHGTEDRTTVQTSQKYLHSLKIKR